VAKPALGKGLGELLQDNRAPVPQSVTATRAAGGPQLSAGLSTLVKRTGEPAPTDTHAPSPVVLRASLLVADVALTGGAVIYSQVHQPQGWMPTLCVLAAVGLGAWLGWLGLRWGRE
jgi:hypothetical protein